MEIESVDRPAKTRVCHECGAIMETARIVPGFGVLPQLSIFRCLACGEVVTIVETAASLVEIPTELGFV